MRRFHIPQRPRSVHALALALTLSITLALAVPFGRPAAEAGEGGGASERPTAKQLLERILSASAVENTLAAQYLKQADPGAVVELFGLIRDTIRPPEPARDAPTLLERVRRMRAREPEPQVALVTLTTWILALDAGRQGTLLEEAGVDLDGGRALLDAKEAAALRAAVRERPGARVLTAPTVSMLDGQRSDISVLDQISYLSGYEVVRSAEREVANPQVGTLQDGLCLSLQARVGPAGASSALGVSLRATWADVARPLAVCDAPIGSGTGRVKIQVPHTELTCRDVEIEMPAGTTLLLQGPARGPQGSQLLLLEARVEQVSEAFLGDVLDEARRLAPPPPGGVGAPAAGAGQKVVSLEARFIDVPAARAKAFLEAVAPGDEMVAKYMDDEEVAEFLQRVEKEEGVQVVGAPHLTAYDRQKCNVHVTDEVKYVQDYDVEIVDQEQAVGEPILGVLQEGVVLDMTPTLSEDGKFVTIEFLGTWASVKRPIPDFTTKLAGQQVTIQIPELTVRRSRVTLRLPWGGSVLVRGPHIEGTRAERVVLVRADRP